MPDADQDVGPLTAQPFKDADEPFDIAPGHCALGFDHQLELARQDTQFDFAGLGLGLGGGRLAGLGFRQKLGRPGCKFLIFQTGAR